MEYELIKRSRVINKKEADKLVGSRVPTIEPNITNSCVILDAETGDPVVAYLPMKKEAVKLLRNAVLSFKYGTTTRSSGVANLSRQFGMAPRKPTRRREHCVLTVLATESPEGHQVLVDLSSYFSEQLKDVFPEVWEKDKSIMNQVDDEWRLDSGNLWTSGVVNKSSTLPYHRDAFNFDTWSAMPVIRRNMEGGHLHLAEYDLTIACRDGWVVYFCGYQYVHGVTPMKPNTKDGYRYSVVYYALRGMKDCFTYAAELSYGQKKRTEREDLSAKEVKS